MINVYVIYSQFTVAGAVAYPCEFLFLFHWKEKGLLVNKRLSRYGETLVELNCSSEERDENNNGNGRIICYGVPPTTNTHTLGIWVTVCQQRGEEKESIANFRCKNQHLLTLICELYSFLCPVIQQKKNWWVASPAKQIYLVDLEI